MNSQSDIARLVAERRPGFSLPAEFYRSPQIYQLDLQAIFSRQWVYVGVEPEIAAPGDLFTVDIGSDSIIIVRDDDGAVRAFHNLCRHRGARLRPQGHAVVGNLVCPYHQWTYSLSGELLHCQHMGADFERARHGLKSVHVRSLGGLIFICLADVPAPGFDEMHATIAPYITPHDLAHTKVAYQKDIIEHGNWKLTMENNRECYHCLANHPELTVSLLEFGFGYQPSSDNHEQMQEFYQLLAAKHRYWESCSLPSLEIDRLEAPTGFRAVRLPMARAGESQTLDTTAASNRKLAGFTEADLGHLSFWTQPNSWHHFMSDHVVSFSVLPLAPDRTLLRTRWLVHQDAQQGVDYDLKRLTEVWDATNMQDSALVETAQQGIASTAYQPGPYSPFAEGLVDRFCNWYLARLADAGNLAPPPRRAELSPRPATTRPTIPPNGADRSAQPAAGVFSVTFSQSGRTLACRADQTILSAAESAGLPLPFSCREGRCGTCRSRLVSGQVDMRHAGGIRQRQIDLGDILVCCSRPLSDIVIER
ncbi:MAG TPA: SRPBCC family protein [Steroidobacteraceae bacterium]|jgi:Rieske 2Fe-2S family protein